jgi:hypothetical protein
MAEIKLHTLESIDPTDGQRRISLSRVRVEGGWLYRTVDGTPPTAAMCFVPDPLRKASATGTVGTD